MDMKMDPDLTLDCPQRPDVVDSLADVPLVTIAWRILRSQHKRLKGERRNATEEIEVLLKALASVAEEVYRLRQKPSTKTETFGGEEEQKISSKQYCSLTDRLEKVLADAGLDLLAPIGEPYTSELMNLLENIAQRVDDESNSPYVSEVITPAIMYRDRLLRMGKAVIAVPPVEKAASAVKDNGAISDAIAQSENPPEKGKTSERE